jgi:2,3-bisphosphoglycerate-dependent phosphoglycerate mutase
MTDLYLIRHARSTWNTEGRMQGWADMPLDDLGLRQAQALAERLRNYSFDAIYSSPLARARQTAEAVAAYSNLVVVLDDRLKERDLGQWTGLTGSEAEQQFPGIRLSGEWRITGPPGGEGQAQLAARAAAAFSDILAAHPDGRVAVISHSGTLSAYLAHLLGLSPVSPVHFPLENTGLARVRVHQGHIYLLAFGDEHHLEAMREL